MYAPPERNVLTVIISCLSESSISSLAELLDKNVLSTRPAFSSFELILSLLTRHELTAFSYRNVSVSSLVHRKNAVICGHGEEGATWSKHDQAMVQFFSGHVGVT